MSFLKRLWNNLTGTEEVKVRTRNKKGHYVADDKSTPDRDWETHITYPSLLKYKSAPIYNTI